LFFVFEVEYFLVVIVVLVELQVGYFSLSIKICEELSAKQKSESPQILSLQIRPKESGNGQFVKDFSTNKSVFFLFSTMTPNDRGYGHPAVCGSFTVAKRNSESGRKRC
jgi:hypothetical protein